MSALVNFSLNLNKIPKDKFIKGKKGTYVNFTMSVKDDPDAYGQNASVSLYQSKEERDAKAEREYIGNGQVIWNDGKIVNAPKKEAVQPVAVSDHLAGRDDDDDFPF